MIYTIVKLINIQKTNTIFMTKNNTPRRNIEASLEEAFSTHKNNPLT